MSVDEKVVLVNERALVTIPVRWFISGYALMLSDKLSGLGSWLQILVPRTVLPVVDLVLVNLAVLIGLGTWAVSNQIPFGRELFIDYLSWFPAISVLWLLLATTQDFYRRRVLTDTSNNLRALIGITSSLLIVYFAVYFFIAPSNPLPRGIAVYTAIASFILVGLWRLVYATISPQLPFGLAVHPTTTRSPVGRENQRRSFADEKSDDRADPREGEPEDEVLTVQEVADYLKVSQTTVWRWCQNGKLPAFRVGHQWRIRSEDLHTMTEEAGLSPGVWCELVGLERWWSYPGRPFRSYYQTFR